MLWMGEGMQFIRPVLFLSLAAGSGCTTPSPADQDTTPPEDTDTDTDTDTGEPIISDWSWPRRAPASPFA